jgi:hypothetical protein
VQQRQANPHRPAFAPLPRAVIPEHVPGFERPSDELVDAVDRFLAAEVSEDQKTY